MNTDNTQGQREVPGCWQQAQAEGGQPLPGQGLAMKHGSFPCAGEAYGAGWFRRRNARPEVLGGKQPVPVEFPLAVQSNRTVPGCVPAGKVEHAVFGHGPVYCLIDASQSGKENHKSQCGEDPCRTTLNHGCVTMRFAGHSENRPQPERMLATLLPATPSYVLAESATPCHGLVFEQGWPKETKQVAGHC